MSWNVIDWGLIGQATLDTTAMVGWSLLLSVVIGLPIGIYLFLCADGQPLQNKPAYQGLSVVVNILRSVPFIILLIVLIPFTRLVAGTSLGVPGAIPPLVVGTAPFFARLVENVLRELDPGILEASRAMGANTRQTIFLTLLPEATTGLISAIVVTAIVLISYSAMSGVIGGGGLGDVAIRYGYQRYQTGMMIATVAILVIMVQIIQMFGDWLVNKLNRK